MWDFSVAPWIQEVAPTTEMCDVALCSAWHLVPDIRYGILEVAPSVVPRGT